jgi:O-succinylbenzoate synthase
MAMRVERVQLRVLRMDLKVPFATSFGTLTRRRFVLVEVDVGGVVGLGEVTTFEEPVYSEEYTAGALAALERFLVPRLLGRTLAHPTEVEAWVRNVRGHRMAKAGVEGALWDAFAKAEGIPLWQALGGEERPIPVGVALGLAETPAALVDAVARYRAEGYRRVKVKIEPGRDLPYLEALRRAFPDLPLMVDANASYSAEDLDRLQALAAYDLMMIEQPFDPDDLVLHARLQRRLATPVCLDESVANAHQLETALALQACRVVNIKAPRVGGLTEARRVHDVACAAGLPVWCGGMLESGIGRAHSLALASLPGFTLPGDISASDRYWHEDLVEPPMALRADGTLALPAGPGIGVHLAWERVQAATEEVRDLWRP